MRVRAAQERGVQQTGHANVVNISSLADQQPSVFQPGVTRSDRACGQLIARVAFSTTSLGVAYSDATIPSTSGPLTGLISIIVFFASARKAGSFIVSSNALRSTALRSAGVPGGATKGRASTSLATTKFRIRV